MSYSFTDGATGERLQYADAPDIPLCEICAVKTVQKGAGVDLRINPALLADPVLTMAFIQDARILLDRIEAQCARGTK